MQINVDTSAFRQTNWQQYLTRFLLGGLITVAAGAIARKFGPVIGGLFLAFPAIVPASATLIEKHEIERKAKKGLAGATRGRQAASVDAAGAAMGSIGLLVFALLVWKLVENYSSLLVLSGSTVAWLAISLLTWQIRKRI